MNISQLDPEITSAYIVYTQVLSISNRPFPSTSSIRRAWQPLFDKHCFKTLRASIRDGSEYFQSQLAEELAWNHSKEKYNPQKVPFPDKPFIHNLGSVCFNTRRNHFFGSGSERMDFALSLWNPEQYSSENCDIFGYDPQLDDQRMNHLCFELNKPLHFKTDASVPIRGEGKVFVHIYPSGYLVLHIAISLTGLVNQSIQSLQAILRETHPTHRDSQWIWFSRLHQGKLHEIVDQVRDSLAHSIYQDPHAKLRNHQWHSALKILSDVIDDNAIAEHFLKVNSKKNIQILNLKGSTTNRSGADCLIASPQGVVFLFRSSGGKANNKPKQKAVRRLFWKMFVLNEFVLLKRQIYEDYTYFLKDQIVELKEFRLNLIRKATKEDIFRLSAYDCKIRQFLQALDNCIHSTAPSHRRMYKTISTGAGFDQARQNLMKLLDQWEEEVEQWQPPLIELWRKIIEPIRALLS